MENGGSQDEGGVFININSQTPYKKSPKKVMNRYYRSKCTNFRLEDLGPTDLVLNSDGKIIKTPNST